MVDEQQAKEVALKEVLKRVVTIEQAKDKFRGWVNAGLRDNVMPKEVFVFWECVLKHIDEIDFEEYLKQNQPTQ